MTVVDCAKAAASVAHMTYEWAVGGGMPGYVFGPDNAVTRDLQSEPTTAKIRSEFYAENAGKEPEDYKPIRRGASFGIEGFKDSLFAPSPTRFFVGSYSLSIYPIDSGNTALFIAWNDTSFTSAGHQLGFGSWKIPELPSWKWPLPMGTTSQVFIWTEPIRRP
jgi:hypothetical protein